MQDIFICCAASDRVAAEPLVKALQQVDGLTLTVEECDVGELPAACDAASDAHGVVLVLSAESVPARTTRQLWQPVLDRLERAPSTLASVVIGACAFPSLIRTQGVVAELAEASRTLHRWAVALDERERFEVVGFDEQYEYRDVIWIPCAGRDPKSVGEDLDRALDGRRVLVVLDRCGPDMPLPGTTREHIVVHSPEETPLPARLPAAVATCYPDFVHRDFCAGIAGLAPGVLADMLQPLSKDGRILRVPLEARRQFDYGNAPRRRHAELLAQYLSSRDASEFAQLARLELPAALDYCFATDWNFGAGLAWRAREVLKDHWPAETARLLLRLRRSAADHKVRSWVDLCEQELRWMGVEIPALNAKARSNTRQLTLDW